MFHFDDVDGNVVPFFMFNKTKHNMLKISAYVEVDDAVVVD